MTSSNLAVCIGNSLIFSKDSSAAHFVNATLIVQLMIDYHQQLFPEENLSVCSAMEEKNIFLLYFRKIHLDLVKIFWIPMFLYRSYRLKSID